MAVSWPGKPVCNAAECVRCHDPQLWSKRACPNIHPDAQQFVDDCGEVLGGRCLEHCIFAVGHAGPHRSGGFGPGVGREWVFARRPRAVAHARVLTECIELGALEVFLDENGVERVRPTPAGMRAIGLDEDEIRTVVEDELRKGRPYKPET